MDRDPEAIAAAREIRDPRFMPVHARFSELQATLDALRAGGVDGVLFDLGMSSPQLERPAARLQLPGLTDRSTCAWTRRRGKARSSGSNRRTRPRSGRCSAAMAKNGLLNRLQRRLLLLGEEGLSGGPGNLPLLRGCVRRTRETGQDPATRTFLRPLRIHVNQELEECR